MSYHAPDTAREPDKTRSPTHRAKEKICFCMSSRDKSCENEVFNDDSGHPVYQGWEFLLPGCSCSLHASQRQLGSFHRSYIGADRSQTILAGLRSPLSHVPGPWHTRFCRWRLKASRLTGTRMTYIYNLHQKYGKLVRVAPNEISCVDLDSVIRVYKMGGGFEKAQWVGNFADKLPALSLSFLTNKQEAKE